PAGHRNGKRVLGFRAAGLDALIAKNALAIVAHVEFVVDLDRLRHCSGMRSIGRGVAPRERRIPISPWRSARTESLRMSAVLDHVLLNLRRRRDVDGRAQELQNQTPTEPHSLRVRSHYHPRLHFARTRWDKRTRALDLDHADSAYVNRSERLQKAESRRVDPELSRRFKKCRSFRNRNLTPVDCKVHPFSPRSKWDHR